MDTGKELARVGQGSPDHTEQEVHHGLDRSGIDRITCAHDQMKRAPILLKADGWPTDAKIMAAGSERRLCEEGVRHRFVEAPGLTDGLPYLAIRSGEVCRVGYEDFSKVLRK